MAEPTLTRWRPNTPVRFEWYPRMGCDPIVEVHPLEEWICPENLARMTDEEVERTIASAHAEWLLEQVQDGACFKIGGDGEGGAPWLSGARRGSRRSRTASPSSGTPRLSREDAKAVALALSMFKSWCLAELDPAPPKKPKPPRMRCPDCDAWEDECECDEDEVQP